MGKGAREVARLLKVSPTTERYWRGVIDEAGLLKGAVGQLPSVEELEATSPERTPPQQTQYMHALFIDI